MARILVADDQASVRSRIRGLLEAADHEVIEARDGAQAIDLLARDLDLVVTDVIMPVNDGLEVCRHVRRHFPGLPVIVVTAGWNNTGVDLLSVATRLGADLAIAKADLTAQFMPAVARLLGHRSRSRDIASSGAKPSPRSTKGR